MAIELGLLLHITEDQRLAGGDHYLAHGPLALDRRTDAVASDCLHPLVIVINEAEKRDIGPIYSRGYACEPVEALILGRIEDPAGQ